MFGSKKNTKNETENKVTENRSSGLNSLVKGTIIEGNITSDADIRIDCKIIGNLDCKSRVIIGPHGSVDGTVKCANALIEGDFNGKLFVKELLHVKETGVLNAEVQYGKLKIDSGAIYNGQSVSNTSNGKIKAQERVGKTTEAKAAK